MSDINKYTTKEVLNKVLLDSSGNAVNAFSHTTQEAFNAALDDTNSRLNVNLVGGTIGGDVTINGDLTVNGDGAGAYDEIINGQLEVRGDATDSATGMTGFLTLSTAFTDINATDQLGRINFQAPLEAGGTDAILAGASIYGIAEATFANNNNSTGIAFATATSSVPIERMRITSEGKVGIGTSSVNGVFTAFGTPMTAIGAQTVADIFGNAQQDADKGGGIGLGGRYITDSSSVTAFAEISGVKANNTNTNYEGEMVFKTRVNGGNLTERMRIDGSGNVGIGTSSPSSKLHVRETAGDEFFTFANGNGIGLVNNVASHGIGISASQSGSYGGQGSSALIVTEGGGSANAGTVQLVHDGTIGFTYKGGNVGIGRSTNIDKKLHILSSTSGDGITLEQSSVGSNAIRFEANSSALRGLFGSEDSDGGAILSGTSGYAMVLRSEADIFLATNGNNEALKIDTSQNARFAGDVYIKNPTSNDPATLSLWSSDTSIADDDNIGVILAQGSDSGGSPPYTGAKIEFNADAVWDTGTSGYYATRIDFFTQSNSGADTLANPALTIDSSQNATFTGDVQTGGTVNVTGASSATATLNINANNGASVNNKVRFLKETGAEFKLQMNTGGVSSFANLVNFTGTGTTFNNDVTTNERLIFGGTNDSIVASAITPHSNGFIYIAGGSGGLVIGDDATSSRIQIMNDAEIKFEVNGSERMRLDTNSRISLSNNDSGTSNTVFGKLAGDDLASGGNYNAFFGDNTGGNTTGDYNVAIGMQALKSLPDGDKNVAIGVNAMEAQDDTANGLNDCVAIGFEAFQGTNAGTSAPSGTVAIGSQSLKALTSGGSNTAVGYQTGNDITIGANNTILGYQAGATGTHDITGGSNNTLIGYQAKTDNANASNQTAIGASAASIGNNSVSIGNSSVTAVYMGANAVGATTAVIYAAGFNFPDTQVASSDANTLDDYEEGTWTPTYACSSGSFNTLTMDVISATYTKIGRQVTVRGAFRTDNVNLTGASGTLKIAGLPFTSVATHGESPVIIGHVYSWVSNNFPYSGYVLSGTTEILLLQRDTSNGATSSMVPSDLTAGATGDQNGMTMMVTYFV